MPAELFREPVKKLGLRHSLRASARVICFSAGLGVWVEFYDEDRAGEGDLFRRAMASESPSLGMSMGEDARESV